MTYMHEPAREIPVLAEADICVLGGSCTGVFAAIRAARLGARVIIVERQNRFGGTATNSLVNVWHSLWDEQERQQIISGMTEEVIGRMERRDALYRVGGDGERRAFVLNTADLAIELDEIVLDAGVLPHLHTTFSQPLIEDGRLTGVAVENVSGRGAIRSRVFIDATGDGVLCDRMGLPTYTPAHTQPPTTCAHISGWDTLKGADARRLVEEHRTEYDLPEGFAWGNSVPGSDVHMLAGTRVRGVNCAQADDLTRAEIEGRRQLRAIVAILNRYAADGKLALQALPSQIGVRETRHVVCRHRLTDAEVLYGTRFDDAIANGSYRVDIHHHDRPGVTFKYLDGREVVVHADDRVAEAGRWRPETLSNPTFYQIPLRSLVPDRCANLIVAGRMLDAEPQAFGGVRVMVNMNQTGEAAGVAAYHALSANVAVDAVDPRAVRNTLAEGGSLIV